MDDESYRLDRVKRMQFLWAWADTNKDGRLNKQEYKIFANAMKADTKEKGGWAEQLDKADEDFDTILS